ncbi:MAG TPA: VOC family protein, partial [Arthrobacter sp.]|nr:VOC family protein [Arthrobacter sp.]
GFPLSLKGDLPMLSDFPIAPAIPVSDVARARKFYEEVLGFEAARVNEEMGEVEYKSGGVDFFIYATGSAGTNQATAAAWRVSGLDGVMADLRDKGVVFEEYDFPGLKTENGVVDNEWGKGAWFLDSEGNILSLSQRT